MLPYALAGAAVRTANTPPEVLAAWSALPADTSLVVLTPAADAAPGALPAGRALVAVMPEVPVLTSGDSAWTGDGDTRDVRGRHRG